MTVLVVPDVAHLHAYTAALQRGWSPNTTRDVCAEQLAAIAADPDGFLARLIQPEGNLLTLPSGETVTYLPGTTRWMWEDGLCGAINLRHQHGTTALPAHVSGHLGYSVVPWRRREGHGTAALRQMLPVAAALGLPYVIVTCDTDNVGSRRVIELNGGVFLHEAEEQGEPGLRKLVFRVALA